MTLERRLGELERRQPPEESGRQREALWETIEGVYQRLGEVDPTEAWCRKAPAMEVYVVGLRCYLNRTPPSEPLARRIRDAANGEGVVAKLFEPLAAKFLGSNTVEGRALG